MIVNGVSVPDEVEEPLKSGATAAAKPLVLCCPDCGDETQVMIVDEPHISICRQEFSLYCENCDHEWEQELQIGL